MEELKTQVKLLVEEVAQLRGQQPAGSEGQFAGVAEREVTSNATAPTKRALGNSRAASDL